MHILETKIIQSDALSWWPEYNQIEEEERITILSKNIFDHDLDLDYLIGDNYGYLNDRDIIQISVIDTKLQQRIKKGLEKDQIAQQVIKGLIEKELTLLKQELAGWKYNNELLLFKNQTYILANLKLKQKLLKLYHNLPL